MKKIISLLCFTAVLLSLLASCSAKIGGYEPYTIGKNGAPAYDEPAEVNETPNAQPEITEYDVKLKENDFVRTADEPTSTFSADVDTASYAYFRRLVNEGYNMKQLSATAGENLRTEEMVNYFKYDCPTPDGTLFGIKADVAREVVTAVRKVCTKPLIVKLSPNAENIVEMALACEESGADALSLVNTFQAMAIDLHRRKPIFNNVYAGLSGAAIKPIALRMVHSVCKQVHVPVIGIGGISNATDVLEFIMAGAAAVQIGTVNFNDPLAGQHILTELETLCQKEGIQSLDEIRGIL